MRILCCLLFLTSCSKPLQDPVVVSWKGKLKKLQEHLEEVKKTVAKYEQKLYRAQLKEIKTKLKEPLPVAQDPSRLFIQEREDLLAILRMGHPKLVKEAEVLLDQILRLITSQMKE